MQPCDSCFSSNKRSRKYTCVLSKCEERNATAIVSQKTDIKKVDRKGEARSSKKRVGSPKKKARLSTDINVFINLNV